MLLPLYLLSGRWRHFRSFAAPGIALGIAAFLPLPALAQQASEIERRREAAVERSDEAPAIDLAATYSFDVWLNDGGLGDGWRYLDNLDLTADIDLERAVGWRGGRAFAYVLYNNGQSLSELTGDAQIASNIETGARALRLYEAWIEQEVAGKTTLKAGLYDLNSEFDALESSALFLGSQHGIGTDISQSGENGPSIFPVTSLAVRLQSQVSEKIVLRFAVLDGVPGNPGKDRKFVSIHLGNGDGVLLIGEADWSHGPMRVIGGGWGYTANQPQLDGAGEGKSRGAYLRGEWTVLEKGGQAVRLFARWGMASGEVNPSDQFYSFGANLLMRGDWQFGAAFARARSSSAMRRAAPALDAETTLELTAAKAVTDWLSVQPDLQYIVNPGVAPGVPDAVVAGVRVTVSL